LLALQEHFGTLSYAYVIDWIPEQEADIYTLIVSENRVVELEISKDNGVSIINAAVPLQKYKHTKGLAAEERRKLQEVERLLASAK